MEPTVLLCSVPMFYAFGNVDDIAWVEGDGRLAPFLIPSLARYADENLASTMMDVPVVAASWFEGYV